MNFWFLYYTLSLIPTLHSRIHHSLILFERKIARKIVENIRSNREFCLTHPTHKHVYQSKRERTCFHNFLSTKKKMPNHWKSITHVSTIWIFSNPLYLSLALHSPVHFYLHVSSLSDFLKAYRTFSIYISIEFIVWCNLCVVP